MKDAGKKFIDALNNYQSSEKMKKLYEMEKEKRRQLLVRHCNHLAQEKPRTALLLLSVPVPKNIAKNAKYYEEPVPQPSTSTQKEKTQPPQQKTPVQLLDIQEKKVLFSHRKRRITASIAAAGAVQKTLKKKTEIPTESKIKKLRAKMRARLDKHGFM